MMFLNVKSSEITLLWEPLIKDGMKIIWWKFEPTFQTRSEWMKDIWLDLFLFSFFN